MSSQKFCCEYEFSPFSFTLRQRFRSFVELFCLRDLGFDFAYILCVLVMYKVEGHFFKVNLCACSVYVRVLVLE